MFREGFFSWKIIEKREAQPLFRDRSPFLLHSLLQEGGLPEPVFKGWRAGEMREKPLS